MIFRRVASPLSLPVSLDEAKAACRIEHHDDNDYISGLIEAATSYLDGREGLLGWYLMAQSWAAYADNFSFCELLCPLASVESISYKNEQGDYETLPSSEYVVSLSSNSVLPIVAWPSIKRQPEAVKVAFKVGVVSEKEIPAAVRQAIKMMVAHWYENREAVTSLTLSEVPMSVYSLIAPFRRQVI